MKILSISIAAYNSEKWIERCLDSFCISEIMGDIEVLIINDGSTDRTSKKCQKYISRYPDTFKIFNKENGGYGSTINTGIIHANGKYFKTVDSDDWVEENGITALVNILKSIDVDVVISPFYEIIAINAEKKLKYSLSNQKSYLNKVLQLSMVNIDTDLQMHAITYKTELLKKNFTAIDEHCFYVDMEYLVFYFHLVKSVYISDIAVYDYFIGQSWQSCNLNNMVLRRNEHLLVCKRIMQYWNCQGNREITRKMIGNMLIGQYRTLLAIADPEQSKQEFINFDKWLMEQDDYKNLIKNGIKSGKKAAYVIYLLQKSHYRGYVLARKILKLYKMIRPR